SSLWRYLDQPWNSVAAFRSGPQGDPPNPTFRARLFLPSLGNLSLLLDRPESTRFSRVTSPTWALLQANRSHPQFAEHCAPTFPPPHMNPSDTRSGPPVP